MKVRRVALLALTLLVASSSFAADNVPVTPSAPAIVGESTQSKWNTAFNGITALGTFLVSFLAIFGGRIRGLIIKPKLTLTVKREKPYGLLESKTDEAQKGTTRQSFNIRIGVTNSGRETAANGVLLCDKIWKERPAGGYYEERSMIPRSFLWSTGSDTQNIVPQFPSFVNVAEISEPSTSSGSGSAVGAALTHHLYILVEAEGVKGQFFDVGNGRFLVHLILYANNMPRAIQSYLEIIWSGQSCADVKDSNFSVAIVSEKDGKKRIGGEA